MRRVVNGLAGLVLCLVLAGCQTACELPMMVLPESPPEHLVATNAQVHLRAPDTDAAARTIIQQLDCLGGCVEKEIRRGAVVRLELRLPAGEFERLMPNLLHGAWQVTYADAWGQEVSNQYAALDGIARDLQASIPTQPWRERLETRRQLADLRAEMAYRLQRAAWATVVVHIVKE